MLFTVSLNKVSGSTLELSFHLFDSFIKGELFTQSVVFPAKD
ncbi:TolB domain protein [Wolbachia endosymbiont of Brugia pahangi]|nr:TolB domain protein [Wolbachia endosymbiont of Brugia pahangi]